MREGLTIEHALLGFVKDGPLHGYELYQRLREPHGLWQIWRIKQSRLYAMLDRLERAGYLTSEMELQPGRPARKVLQLTPEGEQAFASWLCSPVGHGRQVRLDFLSRLFFAWREGRSSALELLSAQKSVCLGWLQEVRGEAVKAGQGYAFEQQIHRYREGQIAAMVRWLSECEEQLRSASPDKEGEDSL